MCRRQLNIGLESFFPREEVETFVKQGKICFLNIVSFTHLWTYVSIIQTSIRQLLSFQQINLLHTDFIAVYFDVFRIGKNIGERGLLERRIVSTHFSQQAFTLIHTNRIFSSFIPVIVSHRLKYRLITVLTFKIMELRSFVTDYKRYFQAYGGSNTGSRFKSPVTVTQRAL